MRISRFVIHTLATDSLLEASALAVDVQKAQIVTSLPTDVYPSLVLRQDWGSVSATGTPTPKPIFAYDLLQPSVLVPAASHSYIDVPTATSAPQAQDEGLYTPKREHFGSRSTLVIFGVIGVVVLIVIVWAIIAHRSGRRPFACFGGCGGRSGDVEAARSGATASDVSFVGAGCHYDRQPVSMQAQPYPMPAPQRPKPVQHQVSRRPTAEPAWARYF